MLQVNVTPRIRLPRSANQTYSYTVPDSTINPIIGSVALISFRRKRVIGVVESVSKKVKLDKAKLLPIIKILPYRPLTGRQFALWQSLQKLYGVSRTTALVTLLPELARSQIETALPKTSKYKRKQKISLNVQRILQVTNNNPYLFVSGRIVAPQSEVIEALAAKAGTEGKQLLVLCPDQFSAALAAKMLQAIAPTVSWTGTQSTTAASKVWQQVAAGAISIVAGTRSALFLPFKNLSKTVVLDAFDDGHKSWDMMPHYDVRELLKTMRTDNEFSAVVSFSASTLLTEAHEATILRWQGQQSAVEIVNQNQLPPPERFNYLSEHTTQLVKSTGKSVLVFVNRRGYASLRCSDCGYLPRCANCDALLSVAKQTELTALRCYSCMSQTASPHACPECHGQRIKASGFGIERAVSYFTSLAPGKQIRKFEASDMKGFTNVQSAINFINNDNSIAICTATILSRLSYITSKPLTIVPRAESLLSQPSWRTNEHALATLTQLKEVSSRCIIETTLPNHIVFNALQNGEKDYIQKETAYRKAYLYPPYKRLITLSPCDNTLKTQLEQLSDIDIKQIDSKKYLIRLPLSALVKLWQLLPNTIKIDVNPDSLV